MRVYGNRWAIETRQAGLEHQLEMLCSRPDLLLSGSGQVQVSLLQLLQVRPVGAAHPWACRAINAFGDRDILFRSNVRRVLMDCLGVDTDPDVALSSDSLDNAVVITLQRIFLDPDFRPGPRDHVVMVEKLLTLVGGFCTAHPRSKLPAACETAMEFCKSLLEKPDTAVLRDYPRKTDAIVDAVCAMLCQEDGGSMVRQGALQCVGSIISAHDWSREAEALLNRLVTSRRKRLPKLLLRLLLERPSVGSKVNDDVYGLTCAVLSSLCVSSPRVLEELCETEPARSFGPAARETSAMRSEGGALLGHELEPEPELRSGQEPVSEHGGSATSLPAREFSGNLHESDLRFIGSAGGGILGTVVLALRNGCGDDLCGLVETLITVLFDGYAEACVELTQRGGPFYVGDAVQGRDTQDAGTGEHMPGTVLCDNADGTYDVQWESGGTPATLLASQLRRANHAVSSGSPRGVADLLRQAPLLDRGRSRARKGISRQLLQRRDQLARAVLPALLMAHNRKSSVHQKFLSVLIATLEKANRSSPPTPGLARGQQAAVAVELVTDDVELLDNRTVVGHDRTFGTVIASTATPKQKGKWYYEVKIGGSSYGQIGFAVNTLVVGTGSGDGVGDDCFSWAYDGWRQKTWNRASGDGHNDYATALKWSAGSVVGCLLDLDEGQISFSLNGELLGVAFTNVKSQLAAAMRDEGAVGICPAATFTAGRHELRFSDQECEYTPAGYQHYARPTNAFMLHNGRVNDCSQYTEPAPDGTPGSTVVAFVREADADDQSDCLIRSEYPLVGLAKSDQFDDTARGYFEVTVVAAGDDESSGGVDVSVGLAKHTTEPSRVLGCDMDSIGYLGTGRLLWDGVGAEQLLPGDETPALPRFAAGDTIGCGVLQTISPTEPHESETAAGTTESEVHFVRVFWTKNGELVCVSADIIPAFEDWYPAIAMGRASQRVSGNFEGPFQFDLSAFLSKELADAPATTEVTLSTVEDENFAPHLMRTTREMLQSDSLTSLLMALRLITVVLQWEAQSYALLRRQDVVRRVHALACGEMPQSIQSQPRPHAVVRQHAAVVLSVIDHVADGEPPDAQLDYFCGLADRIRAGQLAAPSDGTILSAIRCPPVESEAAGATGVAAVRELAMVLDTSDGITEFEFEQADLAGALLHFIDKPKGLEQLRALFGSDVDQASSGLGPRHFSKLIQMLQGVVACTDTLPVYHVPSDMRGAGSGLSCLLNPLRVAFTPDASLPLNSVPLAIGAGRDSREAQQEMVGMFEPITPIVELEAFIRRSVICTDPRFVHYCRELVGCRVEERADGLDGWRGAHVVGFDQTTGRHSLLYENGNGDAPLVWRLMSSRTYRIQRGRCASSNPAVTAEREFRSREREDGNKLGKKKKSWWARKTGLASSVAEPQWVPQRGMRVGVRSTATRMWEPAVVLSSDSDRVEVIRDHAPHTESVAVDQVLQLDSPGHGDAPEVQWQWFDGQWWSFSVEESRNLEASRAIPEQVCAVVHLHGTRHIVDFRSMSKRNSLTGEENPVRRISTCDLWRELAPEGERAVSDRQELSNITPSDTTMDLAGGDADGAVGCAGADRQAASVNSDASSDMPSRLALRVRCRFGGFTMPGKAGQLVGHRQGQSELGDAGSVDLPGSMTVFQCLMKATDMLDIVTEDGQRSSSRTLMPWQCSFSMVYRLEVIDTATGLTVPSDLESVVEPTSHSADAEVPVGTTQVVVVFENQRCPWTPFGDPKPEKFNSAALLRSDRHTWSDAAGAALPSPETDPLPPNGWVWRGAWYEGSDWEYAYDWESEWSSGGPGPKSWVRRRRWERQLEDLSAPAPEPASAPMQSTPPIEPVAAAEPVPSAGGSTAMIRSLQQQANSPFITRWGLGGSPDAVASRLGHKRVAQAMRDLHGDSFVLDGPLSPPRHVDRQVSDEEGEAVPLPPEAADRPSYRLHKRVFSTLDLLEVGLSDAEEEGERENRKWERALRGSSRAFTDSLRVLAHLNRDTVLRGCAAPTDWLSSKLGFKLRDQLSDPLTLVSGALPEWCECLMFGARFLFPFDLRQLFFRCTAFGPARAVAWLKLQQPRAFDPVGALKVDRWLIKRENFLEQAFTLMSHHAKRKTALQVEFEGPLESGIGSGVHVSFFTDAAARLESWADNVDLAVGCGMPMWVIDSEARGSGDSSSEQLLCELYPHSLLGVPTSHGDLMGTAEVVCRRFQLLGWLFAKALLDQQMDERLLPLRLSPLFLDLALGRLRVSVQEVPDSESAGVAEIGNLEELPFVELASSFIKGGTQVQMLHELWLQYESGELSEEDVDSTLEDYGVSFLDPATGGIVMPSGALLGTPRARVCVCVCARVRVRVCLMCITSSFRTGG